MARTVFVLEARDGAAWVVIYDSWSGGLTLYRDGLVSVSETMYDQEYYAATRNYLGAPVGQVAERVARWGAIMDSQQVDMTVLTHVEYGELMRGVIPALKQGESGPADDLAVDAAEEVAEDRPIVWKRDVPRAGQARYFETRTYGQTTYRVGGSSGRWFVLQFALGTGDPVPDSFRPELRAGGRLARRGHL